MPPDTKATGTRYKVLFGKLLGWIGRSGRLEVTVLLSILGIVVGLWTFGVLAAEVAEGDTRKFDERILLALRQPDNVALPIGPAWTLQVARDLTAFGGSVGIGLITAVVAGYLGLQRKFGLLTFVLASVVTGTLLALALKEFFHRARPQIVPHLTDISTASFPSGHSMMSSVAYLTLAALLARVVPEWQTKLYFMAVAVLLITLIGFSRVYLGVHFPTDVMAGWCIGCTWAVLCSLTAHLLSRSHAVPKSEELSD